jgi:Glycosyltransferase family 87
MRFRWLKHFVLLMPMMTGCVRHTRVLQQQKLNSPVASPDVLQLVETVNRRYDQICSLTATLEFGVTVSGPHPGEETDYTPCSGYILFRKPYMLRVLILVPVISATVPSASARAGDSDAGVSRFRVVWFALNGAVLVIGLLVVARMLGPVTGTRALLFSPLVLASDITIATLQVGNLQAIVSSLAMIAMVLLAQRHYASGGALLAYATVSKLFPGLLLVYLLVQRKWRALAWTVGLCIALVAISLVDTGWAPYKAFLDHLPKLLGRRSLPGVSPPLGRCA